MQLDLPQKTCKVASFKRNNVFLFVFAEGPRTDNAKVCLAEVHNLYVFAFGLHQYAKTQINVDR